MYPYLVAALAIFAILRGFLRFRDRQITLTVMMLWLMMWVAVSVVSFVPQVSDYFTRYIGIGRGVDLVFFCTLLLLLYGCFVLYVRSERAKQDITRLVRQMALAQYQADQTRQAVDAKQDAPVEVAPDITPGNEPHDRPAQ